MGKLLITTKAEFQTVLAFAREQTESLRASSGFKLLDTVLAQLEHMRASTEEGREPTDEERGATDVGPIAVRNFDETHPDYAKLLKELDYAFRNYGKLP
jgi:hypothetical protein